MTVVAVTDRAQALALAPVSRETEAKFEHLVSALRRWQGVKNLVGPATLATVWTRHIADSAQLLPLAPVSGPWLDLGSGGGFPGLVVSVLRTEAGLGPTMMVESNGRKCAFLRQMVHELAVEATVHEGRMEVILPQLPAPIAVVSARALAPLAQLLAWTNPLLRSGAVAIFPKGQDVEVELRKATASGDYTVERLPSLTEAAACILRIRMAPPRGLHHVDHP